MVLIILNLSFMRHYFALDIHYYGYKYFMKFYVFGNYSAVNDISFHHSETNSFRLSILRIWLYIDREFNFIR